MEDKLEFQTLVRKRRLRSLIASAVWIIIVVVFLFVLLIVNFENADIFDLDSIVLILFLLTVGYYAFKTIKELPIKSQNDKILNSPENITFLSKIVLWTGGKEGKFDVTFHFEDGSKEEIRFYNIMIQLIVPRIFGDKVVIKNKYE